MSQILLNPVFSSLANDKCSMEIWMKPAASHLPRKSFKERQQVGGVWNVVLVINSELNEDC